MTVGIRMKVHEATKAPRRKRRHYKYRFIVLGVLVSLGIVDVANGFVFSRPRSPTTSRCRCRCRWRRRKCPVEAELRSIEPQHSGGESVDDGATEENANANANAVSASASLLPLLKLASAHCASQALHTAVQLRIPDILHEKQRCCSLNEICKAVAAATATAGQPYGSYNYNCSRDALLRTMRLLTTIDIVREERLPPSSETAQDTTDSFGFSLTRLGASLRSTSDGDGDDGGDAGKPTMASCVLHWMEAPLWNAWLGLPSYIREGESSALPFERANGGVSSDLWYNREDHPESLRHANDFVRLIHDQEIRAVARDFDWSFCRGKRLVDVGGHNGLLAAAIASREPTIDCYCLDLPGVIEGFREIPPEGVTLVPGNVFEPATIPACDVILMKHFCDRCMWTESETVDLLVSCRSALRRRESGDESGNESGNGKDDNGKDDNDKDDRGTIIVAEAVLPDCGEVDDANELSLYLDALYMLVGRERQRTKLEWERLADAAGLDLVGIESTGVPSCSLIILETRRP